MNFEEYLEQIRNAGDSPLPEGFADELQKSYTEAVSTREAQITEHESTLAAKENELAEARAALVESQADNYRLMKRSSASADDTGAENPSSEQEAPDTSHLITTKRLGE